MSDFLKEKLYFYEKLKLVDFSNQSSTYNKFYYDLVIMIVTQVLLTKISSSNNYYCQFF
jgi:hypothetical protein